MSLSAANREALHRFFTTTEFSQKGAVITDLDGTAIHEWDGRYGITTHVEVGLKAVYETGRPVVVNTLRFPLSVMRTFGREWYQISRAPILTVLLNGSLLGYIHEDASGIQRYEELDAFPLREQDVADVLDIIKSLLGDGLANLLVFYYPRDWRLGEIIWTPLPEAVAMAQEKYRSAEHVWSSDFTGLEQALREREHCMIFLHADAYGDERMAYQHTRRRDFFTRAGVDKLYGTQRMAEALGFSMDASLGAGDSSMDTFLQGVAQAVYVGRPLEHAGTLPSILASGPEEFGALLMELASLQRTAHPNTHEPQKDRPAA